jgi:hypothetical protein
LVSARVVDENTMRLYYNRANFGGPWPQIEMVSNPDISNIYVELTAV